MRTFTQALLCAVTITLVLAACRAEEPEPTVSPLPLPVDVTSSFDSPIPTPTRTPRSDAAVVQGVLLLTNPAMVAPMEDGVYLVPIETGEGIAMVMPVIDPETSIQAEVDEVTGQFVFAEVPAGLYALVALADTGQQLSIREFPTGDSLILTVEETDLGQVIDLATVRLP
jgi:hypothetical protein